MANSEMCWINFDNTVKAWIDHFQLEGTVVKYDMPILACCRIFFDFSYSYLYITEYHDHSWYEASNDEKLQQTFKHLKHIQDQFKYYFNS